MASIKRAAREQLQDKTKGRILCAIAGLKECSIGRYLKLPALAVCSRQSHRKSGADSDDSNSNADIDDPGVTVDLHTSECPIEITVHNKDVALAATGLQDCAVNSVLTIFAVQRVYSTTDGQDSNTYLTRTSLP